MSVLRMLEKTVPAVLAGAVVGTLGTKPDSDWYQGLDRPSWEPPTIAFPIAWTTLYAIIGGATARSMSRMEEAGREEESAALLRALWINMGLNAGWCWLFFTAQQPRLALAEIGLLEASTADLVRRAASVDKVSAAGLSAYAAWNAFATALNAEIVRRNP